MTLIPPANVFVALDDMLRAVSHLLYDLYPRYLISKPCSDNVLWPSNIYKVVVYFSNNLLGKYLKCNYYKLDITRPIIIALL